MSTIIVPSTPEPPYEADLSSLGGVEPLRTWRNADGTYTVQMPDGWTPPGRLTKLAYSLRFSLEERIAIRSSEDPIVADIQHLLSLAEYVDVTDPVTVQGVEYLESVGLLAPGRAAEILDPDWQP